VKVYLGEPTGKKVAEVRELGFGAVITPYQLRKPYPYKFHYYFVDNGAYKLYLEGKEFNGDDYLRCLEKVAESFYPQLPDFIVLPDVVAGGERSLELSASWSDRLRRLYPDFPQALVVQDGMKPEQVDAFVKTYFPAVIFVGGSDNWKELTGEFWVKFSHERGLKAHVGRAGTKRRVRLAKSWGADSIDSALPVMFREKMELFLAGLREPTQLLLPFELKISW
jgi:hypothetical protein